MRMVYLFLDGENGEVIISLVKMNRSIPYFGISDLVEILGRSEFASAEKIFYTLYDETMDDSSSFSG